ncbi:ABC transporter transmembrane domain-containing protein, partial [Microbacterium sp.]|uniref:ABC transporter transmembrane domain-containing protein n=1 Tax=Microbacterium sp. TaxID=51671 RepID=UPI003C729EE3
MNTAADTLGRGPLTRWLPVLGQAPDAPPQAVPFPVTASTTPVRFQRMVLFSAKRYTVPAAVLSVGHQVGEALVPVIAGVAIDQAVAAGDPARLVWWLGVLAVVYVGLSMSARFAGRLTALATERVQHQLRSTLSRRVLHPDGTGSAPRPDGSVVSVMTNDIARIATMGLVVFAVGELAGVIFIAVALLLIHPPLGIVVLIGAPVVVWLMGVLSGNYARVSREYQTLLATTVGRATDLVAGYRVIRGIRAEQEATRRYRAASRQTLHGAYKSVGVLGRFLAGSDTISGVFIAGIAVLAGWFALTGQLSIGGFIAAVGLTQALLPPMEMLAGNAIPLWASAVASSARVLDLLRPEEARTDAAAQAAADAESLPDADAGAGVPVVEVA